MLNKGSLHHFEKRIGHFGWCRRNADAGFDCKGAAGTSIVFLNCISRDNKENFKAWGLSDQTSPRFMIQGGKSISPKLRAGKGAATHVLTSKYANLLVKGLTYVDVDPAGAVYVSQDEPTTIRECSDVVNNSTKPLTRFCAGSSLIQGLDPATMP